MEIQQDFKELFELLNKHKAEYIIVGGYALAFHGAPRFTGDIDVLIHNTTENAERVLRALSDFGFGSLGLVISDFVATGNVIQLGVPPVRIDILTSLTGVSWADCENGKVPGTYGSVPVCFLGKEQLVANKRTLGRTQDLADIEAISK